MLYCSCPSASRWLLEIVDGFVNSCNTSKKKLKRNNKIILSQYFCDKIYRKVFSFALINRWKI